MKRYHIHLLISMINISDSDVIYFLISVINIRYPNVGLTVRLPYTNEKTKYSDSINICVSQLKTPASLIKGKNSADTNNHIYIDSHHF